MTDVPTDLVERWWAFHRLVTGSREERKQLEAGVPVEVQQAYDEVADAVDHGRPGVVQLLAALVDAAPDEDGVAVVAAGPLEDLIHAHGPEVVDEIETTARRSPAFAEALAHVWVDDEAADAPVVQRLGRWRR